MSEQKAAYSPEFLHFQKLVETALVQAAADARELAKQTGTKLVTRETPKPDGEGKGLDTRQKQVRVGSQSVCDL